MGALLEGLRTLAEEEARCGPLLSFPYFLGYLKHTFLVSILVVSSPGLSTQTLIITRNMAKGIIAGCLPTCVQAVGAPANPSREIPRVIDVRPGLTLVSDGRLFLVPLRLTDSLVIILPNIDREGYIHGCHANLKTSENETTLD